MSAPTTRGTEALAVGASLFAQHGYGGTTTRQLAAAMGVTNGTFYHHFTSKEELLERVCLDALEVLTTRVAGAVDAEDTPLARLRALVIAHVAAIAADRDAHITMLTDVRALTGERRARIVAARDRYEHRVRELLSDAQQAGEIRADLDTATLSRLLLNLLNWTIFWFRQEGELVEAELAEQMLTVFLDGARQRPPG